MGRQTTVEGVVREFRFVNPHPFVMIDVTAARGGEAQTWQLELDNRYELTEIGPMSILRDPYTVKGKTLFYIAQRFGGRVVDGNALKVLLA